MSIDPSSFMGGKDMGINVGRVGKPLPPSRDMDLRKQAWRKPDPPRGKVEYEGGGPGYWMLAWALAVTVIVTLALLKAMGILD